MVDKTLNIALENIVQSNRGLFRDDKNSKAAKIEAKLTSLLNEKNNLDPAQVVQLSNEALVLDKVADFSEQIADYIEKNKKDDLQKKKLEEIKQALMERLGIPPEFIDQLSILSKAGPQALREAAGVYRARAKDLRGNANLLDQEIKTIDKEIKKLNELRSIVSQEEAGKHMSMSEYMAHVRYQESLRDKADEVLRQVLESIESA